MRILVYTLMTLCLTVVLQQRCHCFEEEKEVGDFYYHAQATVLSAAARSSFNSRSSVSQSENTSLRPASEMVIWQQYNHSPRESCQSLCLAVWFRNPQNKNTVFYKSCKVGNLSAPLPMCLHYYDWFLGTKLQISQEIISENQWVFCCSAFRALSAHLVDIIPQELLGIWLIFASVVRHISCLY